MLFLEDQAQPRRYARIEPDFALGNVCTDSQSAQCLSRAAQTLDLDDEAPERPLWALYELLGWLLERAVRSLGDNPSPTENGPLP